MSDRIFFGDTKNLLEVTVSKESSNAGVNLAERRADYWNFGGLYRPVFIVAKPAQNISRVAIDAQADGSFTAGCYLNKTLEGARIKTVITDRPWEENSRSHFFRTYRKRLCNCPPACRLSRSLDCRDP